MGKRKFEVGQRIWKFDGNTRIYARDERGHATGSPIYEKHFNEYNVQGIEGRSYRICYGSPHRMCGILMEFTKAESTYVTDAEKDDMVWRNEHRLNLSIMVRDTADVATLRRVAEVVGYDPKETS